MENGLLKGPLLGGKVSSPLAMGLVLKPRNVQALETTSLHCRLSTLLSPGSETEHGMEPTRKEAWLSNTGW